MRSAGRQRFQIHADIEQLGVFVVERGKIHRSGQRVEARRERAEGGVRLVEPGAERLRAQEQTGAEIAAVDGGNVAARQRVERAHVVPVEQMTAPGFQ